MTATHNLPPRCNPPCVKYGSGTATHTLPPRCNPPCVKYGSGTATHNLPPHYIPNTLSRRDRKKQMAELLRSRKSYRRGVYYQRKKMASFTSRPSRHVTRAKKMYGVQTIGATRKLARATGCSRAALAKIINKGKGAYYSSGSRPNQTAQSWGIARLASAITAGNAAKVDYNILQTGCHKNSRALRMAAKK